MSVFQLRGHGLPECFLNRFQGDPIVDVCEEALDNEPDGGLARYTASLCREDHLLVDPASRRAVGATDIVGFDLQTRDRISAGMSESIKLSFFW